jgi:hypothetical protein
LVALASGFIQSKYEMSESGTLLHFPRCTIYDAIGQERTKIDFAAGLLGRE